MRIARQTCRAVCDALARILQNHYFYGSNAGLEHADLLRSSRREIDDTVGSNSTVIDPYDYRSTVPKIDDANHGAEWKCRVTRSQRALIKDLAARCGVAIEEIAVPGSYA